MDGYTLTRNWFEFAEEENVTTHQTALYFWCIELCNRLNWSNSFGLPTDRAMQMTGIGSYRKYISTLKELNSFDAINILSRAKNNKTSTRISLNSKFRNVNLKSFSEHSQVILKSFSSHSHVEYNKTNKEEQTIQTREPGSQISESEIQEPGSQISESEIQEPINREPEPLTPKQPSFSPPDPAPAPLSFSQIFIDEVLEFFEITEQVQGAAFMAINYNLNLLAGDKNFETQFFAYRDLIKQQGKKYRMSWKRFLGPQGDIESAEWSSENWAAKLKNSSQAPKEEVTRLSYSISEAKERDGNK